MNIAARLGKIIATYLKVKAIKHLKKDQVMAGLIERIGPVTLNPRRQSPFQSLVRAIIYQQLSGKAASTILSRFEALVSNGVFPTPQQVLAFSEDQLRAVGLSKPKATYIRGLCEKAAAKELPTLEECDQLTDAEILQEFTKIKGVGRWTAEMFLIFNLGRLDVLPVHDLGVRRGFQMAYAKKKLPEPEKLERFGQRWKPYRTMAALYLWRAADFA